MNKFKDFLDRHSGVVLALPALLLLLIFVVIPFGIAIRDSFTNQSLKTLLHPALRHNVGLANYRLLLHDRDFFAALWHTFTFVLMVVPAQVVIALSMAVIVNGTRFWQRFLRVSFFLPVVVSMAVLAVVWGLLYNPSFGLINRIFDLLGLPAQPFLTSPHQAMLSIAVMSIWQGAGFQMMLFLAGLQNIPAELYEAATVEGASRWQQFHHVTLPLLKNSTVLVVTITSILAFKLFVQPQLLTNGGPDGATTTLILQLYHEAFTHNDFARASAISVVFFMMVLAVTLIQRRFLPREAPA